MNQRRRRGEGAINKPQKDCFNIDGQAVEKWLHVLGMHSVDFSVDLWTCGFSSFKETVDRGITIN